METETKFEYIDCQTAANVINLWEETILHTISAEILPQNVCLQREILRNCNFL